MSHYNPTQKNPPWVRSNVQQQPLLAQQMTVQSVALSQPALTTTHLAAQNQIGQVQITPAIQSHQVQIPLNQAHLLLNQQLTPAFGQVQINQAQLANIATSQHQATAHQTYFTPSISLQQNVGIPQGAIQIQPSSLVIPTTISTSIAPPGLAMPTTLSTVQNSTTYPLSRMPVGTLQVTHQQQQATVKQRVFSGIVTKLHENFGFIDEDVIFQASVVKGNAPQVGDRVLVEASYNGSMPFKWNATRVQVIAPPSTSQQHPQKLLASTTLNQNDNHMAKQANRDWALRVRSSASDYRDSDRSTPKSRELKARDRRSRSNSRSPSRKRSRSPGSPRRRSRPTPRYSVQIPKVSLDCREVNLIELRRRYSHMYVPSDFLNSISWWVDSFPVHRPLSLDKPVSFHIFDKEVDPPVENTAVYEPPDVDYAYSAKVMLLSVLPMEEFLQKCCPEDEKDSFVHPARLIRFLVGHRGKNETMAIGGPWSPSLDGADPKSDPQVLIRTAIRTCKALTGIDLSSCTQWYRIAEIRYHRVSSMKSRIESVLLFVPDVWSCVPTSSQWETIVQSYVQPSANESADPEAKLLEKSNQEDTVAMVESQEEVPSQVEPKTLTYSELKAELESRNLSNKGMRSQLIPRLTTALKTEAEQEEKRIKREETEKEEEEENESVVGEETNNRQPIDLDFMAASPQILVHPSRVAKGGKFTCSLVSLSVLLDYRLEDTKEHTFEVSLFSELFNEMLMRDFGVLVYRSVVNESVRKEKKEKKEEEDPDNNKKKKKKIGSASLLLAYCYFDLSHCNYIASKDLEDLFLTLGLQLSRAQVRKLLQKVVSDDTLRYRKLIEKAGSLIKEDEIQILNPLAITASNSSSSDEITNGKDVVPVDSPIVQFNGISVNIEQMLQRLEQSEESRRETEQQFKLAQSQLATCRMDLSKATETISSLCQQLESEKLQVESTARDLTQVQDCLDQYVQAMTKIQSISGSLLKNENIVKDVATPQLTESEFLDTVENE